MKNKYLILILLGGLLLITSCNNLENMTTSSSKIIITAITGTDLEGSDGSTIAFSDVACGSTIINDLGVLSIAAVPINPLQDSSTYYQDVIIDQIDVEYSRTESGRNVQGVDVPFSFSQKVNSLVAVGESIELPFVLVQHVAKIESPLVELRGEVNQEKVLKLEVKVTVYARDLAGNRLEPVTGSISVWCANFPDDCETATT